MKVGDAVEVCERPSFRSQHPDDKVMWRGKIVRATTAQWVVETPLGTSVTFRKTDNEQVTRYGGSPRYIRPIAAAAETKQTEMWEGKQ